MLKNQKRHFPRVNRRRKTRFFDPKLWVSTKKRDILTFLGRKNHFLIIKYFLSQERIFLRPDSEYSLSKT